MGVTATTRLPAGWYPDPDGGNRRRWWDGREWTQYTAEFQRPTSVDEVEIVAAAQGKVKVGKTGKAGRVTGLSAVKPNKTTRPAKATKNDAIAETTDARAERYSPAERLGWLLAGAAYALPAIRRSRKRRRAHRSSN